MKSEEGKQVFTYEATSLKLLTSEGEIEFQGRFLNRQSAINYLQKHIVGDFELFENDGNNALTKIYDSASS